ncbi:hypothetical protein ACX80U_16425 [Arthrobacter sp. TmT3-37]
MTKLPSILSLAAIAVVLTGCATTPAADSEVNATPTPSASASASATASATPSPAAAATPSSPPAAEPTQEETAPAEAPPVVVETPVKSPAPEPSVNAPVEEQLIIATNHSWDEASRVSVSQGSMFTVTGTGYQPGQNVLVSMGASQSDFMVMEEQSVVADGTGSFSLPITVAPDLAPGAYAVLALVRDGVEPGPGVEATKQFALVDVVPA